MNHSFNVEVARVVGVNAALIIDNLSFWIEKNRANGKHFHEGKFWTYESMEAFCIQFPYFSDNQIRTAIARLVDGGYVVKGNFNKNRYDRTLWYAITENGYKLLSTPADYSKTAKNLKPDEDDEDSTEPNFRCADMYTVAGEATLNRVPALGNSADAAKVPFVGYADSISQKSQIKKPEVTNENPEKHEPIPDTITDTITNTSSTRTRECVKNPDWMTMSDDDVAKARKLPGVSMLLNLVLTPSQDALDSILRYETGDTFSQHPVKYRDTPMSNASAMVVRALEMALDSRAMNLWGYARAILSNWARTGFKSLKQVGLYEKERKRRKEAQNRAQYGYGQYQSRTVNEQRKNTDPNAWMRGLTGFKGCLSPRAEALAAARA